MTKEIYQFCRNYAICRRNKSPKGKKCGFLRPLPIPQKRWQDLSSDYIVQLPVCTRIRNKYQHIVVICDRLIKRRHFTSVETPGSKELVRVFPPI